MAEVEEKKLCRCSDCRSTKLLEQYYSLNKKGEYYKSCDSCRERRKKYRYENREKSRARSKVYYSEHKDQKKAYYEANKERILARKKTPTYMEKNRERCKLYYETHKQEAKGYKQRYLNEKRHHCVHSVDKQICKVCNPNGYLRDIIASRVNDALKREKSKKTIEYLGCDIATLRKHIEDQFTEGMTWDNHGNGEGKWNIDHIIPVMYSEDGNPPTTEQVAERLHYTNCQPMWAIDNITKGNRFVG